MARDIVCIGDIHIPFHEEKYIQRVINDHRKGAYGIVLNGDITDSYSNSNFRKDRFVNFLEEYIQASNLLDEINGNFKRVWLTEGNHDIRPTKIVMNTLPFDTHFLFARSPLQCIIDGYRWNPKIKKLELKKPLAHFQTTSQLKWYVKVGRTIFAHPHRYLATPGQVAYKTYDYMHKQGQVLDCIVVGHVHRLNLSIERHAVFIEGGCLSKEMDYQVDNPKLIYASKQERGYTLIAQNNRGLVDRANTHLIWLP